MAPGAKFSTMTSARFTMFLTRSSPRSDLRLDGDGFFVGVEQQEIPGVLVLARAGLPAQQGAARFAALRVFDLDDLSTQPSECLRAGWAGLELGQVQNTDAGKKGRKPAVCSHFLVLPQWHRLRQMVDVGDINRCRRHSVKSSELHAQMTSTRNISSS